MREWFKRLFCFHDCWKKQNPKAEGITKPSNAWTNQSFWYCGKCGQEKCFDFDHIPVRF